LVWVVASCAARVSAAPKPIAAYGPISVGHPSAGFLVNAERMPAGAGWVLTAPAHAYATSETIEQLTHCLTRVRVEHPGSHPVMLGSLSGKGGGKIPPHDSHRTGRDADVYFFRQPGAAWNEAARREDIDLERTWALLRCFITDGDVDFILIDSTVQGWLEAYALSSGEPRAWVHDLFHDAMEKRDGRESQSVIRHAPGTSPTCTCGSSAPTRAAWASSSTIVCFARGTSKRRAQRSGIASCVGTRWVAWRAATVRQWRRSRG
jgi:hypothetical protein